MSTSTPVTPSGSMDYDTPSTTVLISAFPPFPSLTISLPSSAPISAIIPSLHKRYPLFPISLGDSLMLTTHTGCIPPPNAPLSSLHSQTDITSVSNLVTLRLSPRLLGGKGGFGSQLRAAGGRMSSQKTSNNDSCRDLNGRRLSTLKEAKKLAEYLESEPQRLTAKAEAQKAKLEALERKLGIEPGTAQNDGEPLAAKKHRLDDSEYIEQSRDLVDNVKSAVSAALLKRKKAKLNPKSSANEKHSAKADEQPLASTSDSSQDAAVSEAPKVLPKDTESAVAPA